MKRGICQKDAALTSKWTYVKVMSKLKFTQWSMWNDNWQKVILIEGSYKMTNFKANERERGFSLSHKFVS